MEAWLVATLVLQPVLAEPGPVRLLAVGAEGNPVHWAVDGFRVGATVDEDGLLVRLSAGAHRVEARSAAPGPWSALVRPEPEAEGVQVVPAWWAEHAVRPVPGLPTLALAALLLAGAAAARQAKRT